MDATGSVLKLLLLLLLLIIYFYPVPLVYFILLRLGKVNKKMKPLKLDSLLITDILLN